MKTRIQSVICLVVLAGLLPLDGGACTTLCLKEKNGNLFYGRNFDFPVGQGHIHVNQKNQLKTAMIDAPEKSLTWISRYGSISFNQNGREFPYGGMNEAGLVIEQMMHENEEAKYPILDDRFGLAELQWIQYQLDVSASVADVIASDKTVRVSFTSVVPLHFLAADAGGDVAVIEYVNGKMVVHTGKDLKYPVLANTTYDISLAVKATLDAAAADTAPAAGSAPFNRFAIAAGMVEAFRPGSAPALDQTFAILKSVSHGGTQWSIVYDLKNRAIHYHTRTNPSLRRLSLDLFDFSCAAGKLFVDIEENANAVADFKASDYASNLKLIESVWENVNFLKALPLELRLSFAKYPAGVACDKAQ
ncbi:MAG: linear amide C-N hydrolase [Acidobacteria bacterium]|nr:linear amide C-N hydrolase [Acidobacteriota bacterium]